MPRGSKPGEHRGGRRKGTPNKATAARQAEVAATGRTPLEVMLENMRFAHATAAEWSAKILDPDVLIPERLDVLKKVMEWRQIAQECAKDAAPYVHPKLASVEYGGNDKKPVQMKMTIEFVRAKDGRPAPSDDLPADLPPNLTRLPMAKTG